MSLSIRTNVTSLNAQRNLTATQNALDSALSRLSSGFRITKAGDDAAGLGISTKLESQIRSYNQATRNANDGLSVVQSTEAALNEQANILTRLRELAMQSGSDGVGNRERGYIDTEGQELLAELQRISQVTEYNGTKLLDGSAATLDFQVGIAATGNDVISFNTLNATTAAAGAGPPGPFTAGATSPIAAAARAASDQLGAAVLSGGDMTTATQTAYDALVPPADPNPTQYQVYASYFIYEVGFIGAGGTPGGDILGIPGSPTPPQAQGLALVQATRDGGTAGNATLAAGYQNFATALVAAGGDVNAASSALLVVVPPTTAQGWADMAGMYTFMSGFLAAGGVDPAAVGIGSAAANAGFAAMGLTYSASGGGGGAATAGLGVAGLSLASKSGALAALASIDGALETISSNRATLGATGNRLQSAIANIQAFSESLSAANSRIKDVDVAEETSRMSRAQILMQAGVSVLAQANQMPQVALKLLG